MYVTYIHMYMYMYVVCNHLNVIRASPMLPSISTHVCIHIHNVYMYRIYIYIYIYVYKYASTILPTQD